MEYKCPHCKDTHFITAKILPDGTEEKVFCYCHPLVRKGIVKPLDGSGALNRLKKGKRGEFYFED